MSSDHFLSDVCAVLLEQGLIQGRIRILCRQLEAKGGRVVETLSDGATHLLVGSKVRRSRLPVLLGVSEVPSTVRVVRADWLSACLVHRERVPEEAYDVPLDSESTETSPIKPGKEQRRQSGGSASREEGVSRSERDESPVMKGTPEKAAGEEQSEGEGSGKLCVPESYPTSSRRWHTSPGKTKRASPDSDSDYVDSGDEEELVEESLANVDTSAVPPLAKRKRRWICEIPKSEAKEWVNHNKHITDKLEELLRVYQSSAEDKWRAMSTSKVIQAIKKHPREITSYEEALSLPFVGERLARKIEEIIASGGLRRLEAVDKEKQAVLTAFTMIHGVGQNVAQQFYAQGYRSVEELAASEVLNRQQRIGVKHYHDFQERMQRREVTEIEQQVRELAHLINSGLEVITCGSYRRGKPTCGDVDILVTHSDGRSHRGVLPRLIQEGRECGFLTDDLSIHNDHNGGGKYLGVCRLPGQDRKFRRIDIYVTPYSEFPCMLVHFTGSGHFNRSMRSKADKLNGVKLFEGTPVPVFSERDIFKYLDIEYREATERDWD